MITSVDEALDESPEKYRPKTARTTINRLQIEVIECTGETEGTPRFNNEQVERKKREFYALENYRSETTGIQMRPHPLPSRQVHTMDCKVKQVKETSVFTSRESFSKPKANLHSSDN